MIAALMGDLEGPTPQKRAIPAMGLARELGLELERWLSGRALA